MLNNPFAIGTDLVRTNLETQISMLTSLSSRFFNASLQLGELNLQAGRRLLEESAADARRAMDIRTPADLQAFVGEQSLASVEKARGYWQNVQYIAAQNMAGAGQTPVRDDNAAPDAQRQESESRQTAQHAAQGHPGEHEVDVHPSPLVEKLVATAVSEMPKPDTRT